jgi:hypothetical protein
VSDGPRTLRDLLRDAEPRDFAAKEAFRELVRALRARKRETGASGLLVGQAELDRALSTPIPGAARSENKRAAVAEIKQVLRALLRDGLDEARRQDAAVRVDDLVRWLLPEVAEGEIDVDISGWPDGFGPEQRARLLRRPTAPPFALPAGEAAALVREFHGFALAGNALRVELDLPRGVVLPPVPRDLRAGPMRRERGDPWLPFLDEEGRWSLTPRAIAARQARRVATPLVVDAMCGCGGNSVAFALAGLRVVALDRDGERLALARQNARRFRVERRISFHEGEADALLPRALHEAPAATIFLDPPWGGVEQPATRWEELLPRDPAFERLLFSAASLMLKLPRAFDVATLPAPPGVTWRIHYEFGDEEDDASVLRMLTAQLP